MLETHLDFKKNIKLIKADITSLVAIMKMPVKIKKEYNYRKKY